MREFFCLILRCEILDISNAARGYMYMVKLVVTFGAFKMRGLKPLHVIIFTVVH